jgi:EmrB/QacA subfamily drug resistance transporter
MAGILASSIQVGKRDPGIPSLPVPIGIATENRRTVRYPLCTITDGDYAITAWLGTYICASLANKDAIDDPATPREIISGTLNIFGEKSTSMADENRGSGAGGAWQRSAPVIAAGAPPELDRRQLILALAGVLLCILVSAIDQTIVSTALPRIVSEFKGFDRYSWVVTAYLLTATCVIPIAGKISDQLGRKPILIFGLIVFVLGSALCGRAESMNELIIFRGVQGIGAGALQSGAFASIGDLFTPQERGRWQGVIAATFGLASVFGPSLGGWITDNPGWRWVFYVNVPVGAVALITLLVGFPVTGSRRGGRRIDWLGVATIIAGVVPLLIALTWAGSSYPWDSPQVIISLAVSLVMFALFVLVESRVSEPLLPLNLFGNQIFTAAFIASGFVGPLLLGLGVYLPLFVQGVLNQSATSSGAVITPLTLAVVATNIIGGQIVSRTGHYQRVALVGLVICTIGVLLLLGMDSHTDNVSLVRNMIIIGLGLGFALPVYTIAVQNALPYNRLGVVTSSVQFSRSIGSTIGISVLGSIVTNVYATSFAAAQRPQLKQILASAAASGHAIPSDPQVLVNPATQQGIEAGFKLALGPQLGQALFDQLLSAVRAGLLDGVHASFLALLVMALAALLTTLFLKEIPLRTTNASPEKPGGAVEQVPATPMME